MWDYCPSHLAGNVQSRLNQLKDERKLYHAVIPGRMTSILQLGDICINGPCKKSLRSSYLKWTYDEIKRRKANGERGKLVVKVSREQLMTWTVHFVNDFNAGERTGRTNIIVPCLAKLGQNIFSSETKPLSVWLDSLNENALYKALLNVHTASDL